MADVPKFPVAIVLNAMNFDFAQAKSKGEDVRFVTAEGTALPFEIVDGSLDEARILNVVKDADWAKLEYESQREGQKLVTFEGM